MSAKRTRHFTYQYRTIKPDQFKAAIEAGGSYSFQSKDLSHQRIQLDKRKVGYGYRLYLICPYCSKPRTALFYLNNSFGCRVCFNLHHKSKSLSEADRLRHRIIKLRSELWRQCPIHKHDIRNMFETSLYWLKPKGIHWKTFYRKRDRLSKLESRYVQQFMIPEIDKMIGSVRSHRARFGSN